MPCVLSTTFQLETSEFANSFLLRFHSAWRHFESNIFTPTSNTGLASQIPNGLLGMTSTKNHRSAWPFVWKIQENDWCSHKDPVTRKTFSCHEHCCFRITKVEYQLQTKRILYIFRGLKYSLCNFIRCRWLSSGIKFTENETCRI